MTDTLMYTDLGKYDLVVNKWLSTGGTIKLRRGHRKSGHIELVTGQHSGKASPVPLSFY